MLRLVSYSHHKLITLFAEYWKVHDPASHSVLTAAIQRDITSEMDQISLVSSSASSPMKVSVPVH
jgi:hypothetical protein